MKAKQALDIDALVAATVPPRPNPQLAFTVPGLRVDSETNAYEHWRDKGKRRKKQKEWLHNAWLVAIRHDVLNLIVLPCVVRLTRIGQKRLDDDNLREAFKAIRDQIASEIGVDDGDDRIKWEYAQCAVGKRVYSVRVEVY